MRLSALVLALSLGLGPRQASAGPTLQARVTIFQAGCSQVLRADVEDAVAAASRLLTQGCGIGLSLTAWTRLPLSHALCALPGEPGARSKALQAASARLKAAAPRSLALILLPTDADPRLSWALVDRSRRSACDSPQEPRFLPRFGSLFFTDLSWGLQAREDGLSQGALLLAHEVLHALTHRGHPSGAAHGHVMADHVAAMGPKVDEDWCECARMSPYLRARQR
jgi:hypothetical protein